LKHINIGGGEGDEKSSKNHQEYINGGLSKGQLGAKGREREGGRGLC